MKASACGDAVAVPDSVRQATFPVHVETQKLAEGVYVLGGASHNSVAAEFRDYVAVVEAPLDEQRNLAVIEEIVKLVPNKPIRFLVNTHQHHDHIGGLRTDMHIGATIITHWRISPLKRSSFRRTCSTRLPQAIAPDHTHRRQQEFLHARAAIGPGHRHHRAYSRAGGALDRFPEGHAAAVETNSELRIWNLE